MTKAQALAKAVELFGKNATAQKRKCSFFAERKGRPRMCSGVGIHPQPCPSGVVYYQIGQVELGLFNSIRGHGLTWEACFEQYAERQRKDHEAFEKARRDREDDVRPADEFCREHPEDGEHERKKTDRDHCVYCGARLAP